MAVAGGLLLAAASGGAWEGAWRGDLLFLGAVCAWAVYTVLVQRWRLPALDATPVAGLLAAPLYLPLWCLALPSTIGRAGTGTVLVQMAFHGAGAVVVAGLLYTRSVTALGPVPTAMIGAAVPALAALIAWPLSGELPPPLGLLAVPLVTGGMALGVVGERRGGGAR